MKSELATPKSGWIRLPDSLNINHLDLENELQAIRDKRIESGDYSIENIRYVSKLSLSACSGELSISDQKLEKLRRLCQLWDVKLRPREISSHRKLVGPVIVAVKRAIYPVLKFFLKDMLHQQREFNAATIRLLAEIARDEPTKKE